MVKFILYLLAIAVIFGAGYIAGSSHTGKKSKVNSYLRGMRSPEDYRDN